MSSGVCMYIFLPSPSLLSIDPSGRDGGQGGEGSGKWRIGRSAFSVCTFV